MTTPPDRPRDDRRMHEGRKPGLDEPGGNRDTTTLERKEDREAAIEREQDERVGRNIESGSKGYGGTPDRTSRDKGGDSVQQSQQWSGGSKGSKGPVTAADRANENSTPKS